MSRKPIDKTTRIFAILILSILLTGCGISDIPGPANIGKMVEEITPTEEPVPVEVVSETTNSERVYGTQRVFDNADMLTDEEAATLETYISKAEKETSCDIVIVTLNKSLKEYALEYQDNYETALKPEKYTMVYADNFWEENKFGYDGPMGEGRGDGVILVDNLYREDETGKIYTWLATTGIAEYNLSNSDINAILDAFYEYVDIDYYQACIDYVNAFADKMSKVADKNEASSESGYVAYTKNSNTSDSDNSVKSYSDDRVADLDSILSTADINNVKAVNYDITSYDGRWTYNVGYNYNIDIYNYYHNINRYYDTLDYNRYVFDEASVEYVKQLVGDLDELFDSMEFSESDKVREVVNFVQSIAYVSDKDSSGKDEWPKYAVETLYEQNGDCEDLSILLAGMLSEMNYGCCLIVFDDHVAVGLLGDNTMSGAYYEIDGKMYFYIETTDRGWGIGEIPDQYDGAQASIIPIR